jgi:hypothetical protein
VHDVVVSINEAGMHDPTACVDYACRTIAIVNAVFGAYPEYCVAANCDRSAIENSSPTVQRQHHSIPNDHIANDGLWFCCHFVTC